MASVDDTKDKPLDTIHTVTFQHTITRVDMTNNVEIGDIEQELYEQYKLPVNLVSVTVNVKGYDFGPDAKESKTGTWRVEIKYGQGNDTRSRMRMGGRRLVPSMSMPVPDGMTFTIAVYVDAGKTPLSTVNLVSRVS